MLNEKNDIIFPGKNWQLNACINYMPMDYAYIWGYCGGLGDGSVTSTRLAIRDI